MFIHRYTDKQVWRERTFVGDVCEETIPRERNDVPDSWNIYSTSFSGARTETEWTEDWKGRRRRDFFHFAYCNGYEQLGGATSGINVRRTRRGVRGGDSYVCLL